MAELFGVESHTITYHLKEIYKAGELEESATTRKIRVVQKEGSRDVSRDLDFYNLDAIIAVGYRVKNQKLLTGKGNERTGTYCFHVPRFC